MPTVIPARGSRGGVLAGALGGPLAAGAAGLTIAPVLRLAAACGLAAGAAEQAAHADASRPAASTPSTRIRRPDRPVGAADSGDTRPHVTPVIDHLRTHHQARRGALPRPARAPP